MKANRALKTDPSQAGFAACFGRSLASLGLRYTTEVMMEIDTDKVDEAALAILYLTLHDRFRAWKGIDWDVLNRLYDKGLIGDPVGKQKSVVFTDEGLREAERCFRALFAKK